MNNVRPQRPLDNYELDDRYRRESGRVFLTGTQALVRIPLMQRTIDRAAGFNTAGFISGYRGSPLGAYDMELWRASRFLEENDILSRGRYGKWEYSAMEDALLAGRDAARIAQEGL